MAKRKLKPKTEEPEDVDIEDVEDDFEEDEDDKNDNDEGEGTITVHRSSHLSIHNVEDPVLYLEEGVEGPPAIMAVTHPDLAQCQCEWQDMRVETLGPKPLIRCGDTPTVIAFQKRVPGEHEPTGAISLCPDHRVLMDHLHPGQCYYRRITSDNTIGDFA